MLVVVANRHDSMAAGLAERWASRAGQAVALLTPADLSQPGWRLEPDEPRNSTAVLGGRRVAAGDLTGVLARLSRVLPQDLPHIVPADRPYVAQEMTAFLLAWLASLACPVLNRPTPACLAGPAWRQERWLAMAKQLGIPVGRIQRDALWPGEPAAPPADEDNRPVTAVTVVAGGAFGQADGSLSTHALRLADASGCRVLAVYFDAPGPDGRLVGVDLWPDLSKPEIADAALAWLEGERPC